DAYHYAVFHFWLPAQCRLQIVWVNVRASGCDDHFFFSSLEVKVSGGIQRADITSAIPAFVVGDRAHTALPPIAGSHSAAAHQNLAIGAQLHFPSGKHLADRPLSQPERMVDADQRRRLCQPVTLNDRVPQSSPELLGFTIQCGAPRDKRPELPSELAADAAKNPPAMEKVLVFSRREALAKTL